MRVSNLLAAAGAILFAYGALFTTAVVYQRRSRSGSE